MPQYIIRKGPAFIPTVMQVTPLVLFSIRILPGDPAPYWSWRELLGKRLAPRKTWQTCGTNWGLTSRLTFGTGVGYGTCSVETWPHPTPTTQG